MRLSHFRISAAIVGLVPTTIVGFALIANTQIEPARAATELYHIAGGRFDPKPPPPRPLSQREIDAIIRRQQRQCRPNPLDALIAPGERRAYYEACSRPRSRVKIRTPVRFRPPFR
ncbi:hypothetical protein [Leptolyngbya sp. NIES-2104]|uniref:hypothetical protein n=1 Tax=Leptolyngbya sp. NIES-2104 TaxID=1552121 RepID=UPI000A8B6462|nr:hypothetical protein [Leptolyngbya sp. NIES-2104]